jgi:hypothetical protein
MQEETDQKAPPERRRRALRWGRRVVGPLVVTGALFGASYYSAGSESARQASVDGAQPIHYQEECLAEGCSNEEINELWVSFQEECFGEGCWTEEVFELSGGPHYHDAPYHWESQIPALFHAFRTRLGRQFNDPEMRVGLTDTFWRQVVQLIDGRVVKTPPYPCDPYCG